MEKKLPKVYVNPIKKNLNNNEEIFYSTMNRSIKKGVNVLESINKIFSSPNHVYKSKVRITTNTDTFDALIVGKTNDYLLTLSGDKISIPSILNIERI